MENAYTPNEEIVKPGDVFVYDASMVDGIVINEYIVVLRTPSDLKKSSKVHGVRLFKKKPEREDDTKIVQLNTVKDNRYIDCDEPISIGSHRLGVKCGAVNKDCVNAIFELMFD